jgi:hypothetical protein
VDFILQNLQNIFSWVLALLPDSPFQKLTNSPIQPYLKSLNWIVPVDFMISTMELWLTAIAVYYVYQAVLRWARAIS